MYVLPELSMFAQLLERLAGALDRAKIPYMIIGGQAVLLYGEPRLTRDIDVTLGVDVNRLADLVTLADGLSLSPLVDPEPFTRDTLVLPCQDATTGIRVDFIFSHSPYEQQAIRRATAVTIGGTPVRFASVEDLIVHKMLANRPRDLEDVSNVLLKQPHVDLEYIRNWLAQFSQALTQPILEQFEQLLKSITKS
jgi:Nucleotidyl transferase AbiEii toxin, Type IV TA system